MAYRVYYGLKPADTSGYPQIAKGCGFDNSIFLDKRDAEVYAFMWSMPVTENEAQRDAPKLRVNVPTDYGLGEDIMEFPVVIKEI